MKRTMILALAAVAIGSGVKSVEAACERRDLQRDWRVYAFGASAVGEAFWQGCVIRFDADGRITPPRSRCTESNRDVVAVSGGILLQRLCRLVGNYAVQSGGETLAECDIDGALSQDKTVVDCDDGSLLALDMIKR